MALLTVNNLKPGTIGVRLKLKLLLKAGITTKDLSFLFDIKKSPMLWAFLS